MSQHQHQHQEQVTFLLDVTIRNTFSLEEGQLTAGRARCMHQALKFLQDKLDEWESEIVVKYQIQPKALSVLDYVIAQLEDFEEDNPHWINYQNEMLNPNTPNLELHIVYTNGSMTDSDYKNWNIWYRKHFAPFLLTPLHHIYMYIIRLRERVRFIHDNYNNILNLTESTFVRIMKNVEKLLNSDEPYQ